MFTVTQSILRLFQLVESLTCIMCSLITCITIVHRFISHQITLKIDKRKHFSIKTKPLNNERMRVLIAKKGSNKQKISCFDGVKQAKRLKYLNKRASNYRLFDVLLLTFLGNMKLIG